MTLGGVPFWQDELYIPDRRGWHKQEFGLKQIEDRMFDATRLSGADQILNLARRVAAELAHDAGRCIRVVGWSGSDGKMTWEYVVEIDGHGCNLEVGDPRLLAFPHDERVRAEVEERIRHQMRCGLQIVSPERR